MHIPGHILSTPTESTTAVISAIGVLFFAILAIKSKNKPQNLKFAAVTALIFAFQMVNFPVQYGTSGHLLGTTMAIVLLGIPYGILSMVAVLTIQCFVFADGAISALGANILNMALVAAIPAIILCLVKYQRFNTIQKNLSIFVMSLLSIVLASFVCSIEVASSGTVEFSKIVTSMVGIHALIGIGEGLITVVAVSLLSNRVLRESNKLSVSVLLVASLAITTLLSPFASEYPDGLGWIMQQYGLLQQEIAPNFVSPLSGYVFLITEQNSLFSGIIAGAIGVLITFIFVSGIGSILKFKEIKKEAK